MAVTLTGFDHAVGWREFSRFAERQDRGSEDAFIRAATHIDYDYEGTTGNYAVTGVQARVWVDQGESWVVQGSETDALLAHEQGHFDITALGLREEAHLVDALTGAGAAEIQRQRRRIRRRMQRRINQANERYDARTEHSRNAAVQRRWLRSIAALKERDDGTIDELPD